MKKPVKKPKRLVDAVVIFDELKKIQTEIHAAIATQNRLNACAGHRFTRLVPEPAAWYCTQCKKMAERPYVVVFSRGLVAGGVDPGQFISDYGEWS